jgi:hypothetical protein
MNSGIHSSNDLCYKISLTQNQVDALEKEPENMNKNDCEEFKKQFIQCLVYLWASKEDIEFVTSLY